MTQTETPRAPHWLDKVAEGRPGDSVFRILLKNSQGRFYGQMMTGVLEIQGLSDSERCLNFIIAMNPSFDDASELFERLEKEHFEHILRHYKGNDVLTNMTKEKAKHYLMSKSKPVREWAIKQLSKATIVTVALLLMTTHLNAQVIRDRLGARVGRIEISPAKTVILRDRVGNRVGRIEKSPAGTTLVRDARGRRTAQKN